MEQNNNKTVKPKIQFKPVHEGMGFHPFSDGLPYAPASQVPQTHKPQTASYPTGVATTGFGATAAGRPQFVTQNSPRAISPSLQQNARTAPVRGVTQNTAPVIEKSESLSPLTITSGQLLRRRAFAYLLDMVVHAGFWLITNLIALFFFHFQLDSEIFTDNLAQFIGFFVVSQWLFISLQEMLFETSLGKTFFNLEFKRNHRSLLLRSAVFMLGVACLGLGFYFRPQDKLGQITLKSKIES